MIPVNHCFSAVVQVGASGLKSGLQNQEVEMMTVDNNCSHFGCTVFIRVKFCHFSPTKSIQPCHTDICCYYLYILSLGLGFFWFQSLLQYIPEV